MVASKAGNAKIAGAASWIPWIRYVSCCPHYAKPLQQVIFSVAPGPIASPQHFGNISGKSRKPQPDYHKYGCIPAITMLSAESSIAIILGIPAVVISAIGVYLQYLSNPSSSVTMIRECIFFSVAPSLRVCAYHNCCSAVVHLTSHANRLYLPYYRMFSDTCLRRRGKPSRGDRAPLGDDFRPSRVPEPPTACFRLMATPHLPRAPITLLAILHSTQTLLFPTR